MSFSAYYVYTASNNFIIFYQFVLFEDFQSAFNSLRNRLKIKTTRKIKNKNEPTIALEPAIELPSETDKLKPIITRSMPNPMNKKDMFSTVSYLSAPLILIFI